MLSSTRVPRARRARAYLPKKQPHQARAQATYDSIVDAAARLLVERGYVDFTTNHIAIRAGVAIGSLYEYFPDKETVVAEVARRVVREVLAELAAGLEGALVADAEAGVREWVRVMFRAIKSRRGVVRALWMDVPFLGQLDEVKRVRETALDLATRWQTSARAPRLVRNQEAMNYLLVVMAAHGIVEGVVARPRHLSQEDVEETFVHVMVTLLFGATPY